MVFIKGEAESMDWGEHLSPIAVDSAIRHAVHLCVISLPKDKRNIEEIGRQLRRILDRALRDYSEDEKSFNRIDHRPGQE